MHRVTPSFRIKNGDGEQLFRYCMYCHRAHPLAEFNSTMTTCADRAEYRAKRRKENRLAWREREESVGERATKVLHRLKHAMIAGNDAQDTVVGLCRLHSTDPPPPRLIGWNI